MPGSRPHVVRQLATVIVASGALAALLAALAACASGSRPNDSHAGGTASPSAAVSAPATISARTPTGTPARSRTGTTMPTTTMPTTTMPTTTMPRTTAPTTGAAGGHSTTASPHTTVRTFAAYDSSGRLTVPVSGHATGTCFTTSIAAPGRGAYRCIAGNQIEDPCFAPSATSSATPHTLACLNAPWDPAMLLTVRGTLPKQRPDVVATRPWALQLSDGARCVAGTGTVPEVHGVWLDYVCGADSDAAIVPGAGTPSQARIGSANGGQPLTTVAISVVWRS